jgi:hypothetical protein
MVTLEPPRFTKGQFPLKIPGPAGQTRLKMAEMRFNEKKPALLVNLSN